MRSKYTHEAWLAEAVRRFGPDKMAWTFVCPSCGCVWSVQDWKNAGAKESAVASSCVGRSLEASRDIGNDDGQPCNYANFGLFCLDPVSVVLPSGKERTAFGFLETADELDALWSELDEEERAALLGDVVAMPTRAERATFARLVERKLFVQEGRHKKGPRFRRRSLGNRIVEHHKRKGESQCAASEQESHA